MSESYSAWQQNRTGTQSNNYGFTNKFNTPTFEVGNNSGHQFKNKLDQNASNRLSVHQRLDSVTVPDIPVDNFHGNWQGNVATNAHPPVPQHVAHVQNGASMGQMGGNNMYATNSANYPNAVGNVNQYMYNSSMQPCTMVNQSQPFSVGQFQHGANLNRQPFNTWPTPPQQDLHNSQGNGFNQWNVNQQGNPNLAAGNWNNRLPSNRNSENFPLGNVSQEDGNDGSQKFRRQSSPPRRKRFRRDRPDERSKSPQDKDKEVVEGFMTMPPSGTSASTVVRTINARLLQQFGYTGPVVRYGHLSSNYHILSFPTQQVLKLVVHNMSPLKVEGSKLFVHLTMSKPPLSSDSKKEMLKKKPKPTVDIASDDIIELEPMEDDEPEVKTRPNSSNNQNKFKSKAKGGSGAKGKINPRPRGVFPEAIQPVSLVLVVDEAVPYLSLHQLKQKGYKILSGKNLDAIAFLELIRNDESFKGDGVLYVIVPYLHFCLKHLNLFAMEEVASPTDSSVPSCTTDGSKSTKDDLDSSMKQSSDATSLLTIVKDFSSEVNPIDLDVLSSCGGGLSGCDAERDRSMDEPLYAERLLTARLLHSAMRLRAGVRDAALNSDLVFCGFTPHAMRTAGVERCFKDKGSVKQISQITSALLTALRAFNEFAANTWKLGYISKIPSFNLTPDELWAEEAYDGGRGDEEEEDDASDVEILAETSASEGHGRRVTTRGRLPRVASEVITLGDDEGTGLSEEKKSNGCDEASTEVEDVADEEAQMEGVVSQGDTGNDKTDDPADESSAANPIDESPADESPVAVPTDESPAVEPTDQSRTGESSATVTADESSATVPADESSATVPADESSATVPADESSVPVPADESSATAPTDESSATVPAEEPSAADTADISTNPENETPAEESAPENGDGSTACDPHENSTTIESDKISELEDVGEDILDSKDQSKVLDDAEEELEHDVLFIDNTEDFDDFTADDNDSAMDDIPAKDAANGLQNKTNENNTRSDFRKTTINGNSSNIPRRNNSNSSASNYHKSSLKRTSNPPRRTSGLTSKPVEAEVLDEESEEEEEEEEDESCLEPMAEGVLPLSRLGRHRWFGAAVSRGGGRRFNRSLERVTQWYMSVLFRLLDLSSKLMDKRGSFLPWQPPSASPSKDTTTVSGAVTASVEAAVYLECQSLADDEDSSIPVSYTCILCDVDLPDVDSADMHAYTLDHCTQLKKRSNDLTTVAFNQLTGKMPLKNSRGLSQEYLERLERAHLLQRVPSSPTRWRCLACDGHTIYDDNRLRHHVHDLHHQALINVRLGLTKARQRVLQHQHWDLVKTRLRRHPDLSVVLISDDMNYSVLQPLAHLHDRIQVWTFNNLLRDPSGRAAALARWKELSGVAPTVLWLLVTGIDLLVTTTDAQETPNVDQILDHVYSLHSFLRVNLPPSHIVLTTPVLPLNILVDTLPRSLTSSLMNASNSIIVSEDEVRSIRRPYELLFSRSLALHAANAAHENVHRLAKSSVSSCVVRVLEPRDIKAQVPALPHYFMSSPWHVAVEGLALAAVYGLPAPYLRRCHDATAAGLNLHEMEEEPRLFRATVVGDVKWLPQSPLAKRRLTGRKRRLEFSAADLAYVLEYAEPAPNNPVTWCLTAPVPGALMRSVPNPACVTNRCKKGLRTWLYQSPEVDPDSAACNMRTFLTKLQSKLPRGNFANVFPIFPTNIITYKKPDRATHDAIHEYYEQFPNTYFTQEPLETVQESMDQLKTIWGKLFLSNKLGHTLPVDDSFACINVFPITREVADVRKMVIQQAEDWLATVNAYFTDFSSLITVSLAEDAIREPPGGEVTAPADKVTAPAGKVTAPAGKVTAPAGKVTAPAGKDGTPEPIELE